MKDRQLVRLTDEFRLKVEIEFHAPRRKPP
jgi:hypothetical protein